MIQSGRNLVAVLVHGVDPGYEQALSGEMINMVDGSLDVLQAGDRSIILGRMLAYDLGARMGDGRVAGAQTRRRWHAAASARTIYHARHIRGRTAGSRCGTCAGACIDDAAQILGLGTAVTSIRFRADDVMAAPANRRSLRATWARIHAAATGLSRTAVTFGRFGSRR